MKLRETESTKISFRVQDDAIKRLKLLALANSITLSEVLRHAVSDIIVKYNLQAPSHGSQEREHAAN